MKESEAKKKLCPKLLAAFISAGRSHLADAKNMTTCKGSDCVMWEKDTELEYTDIDAVRIEKDNEAAGFVIPDGWVIHQHLNGGKIKIRRLVYLDSGDCGLKTKELYCEGCNQ